jgi:hypothetical protein
MKVSERDFARRLPTVVLPEPIYPTIKIRSIISVFSGQLSAVSFTAGVNDTFSGLGFNFSLFTFLFPKSYIPHPNFYIPYPKYQIP